MPTRREFAVLLSAASQAQQNQLPSKTYSFQDLAVRASGDDRSRALFDGLTHTGFRVEAHHSELAPGLAPHPPHRHKNEEMLVIREGTIEVTISGKTSILGPGSVAFVASGEEHGWRNTGTTRAHYTVIALGSR
ncbi:MAG: cupin domain-containing protein [Acidobacteriia bacterium]|nr:cupin domain-containing protein [Terriglobia bacterium]